MRRILVISVLLVTAFGLGYVASTFKESSTTFEFNDENETRLLAGTTTLSNPLLDCNLGPEYLSKNSIKPFRSVIENHANSLISKGKATHVSYYFRDLNNGSWFGFNEKETFSPASLLKVPLMIHILKRAESNPAILQEEIEYKGGDSSTDQIIKPEHPIEAGKTYTVHELLEHSIIESDNVATGVLAQYVGRDAFETVFTDLGLATIENNGSNLMSVKNYAAFFRILYNASYLSRPLSEAALSLLTQTKFNDGIRAAIPSNIIIAHKFGEREYENEKQLHDCGIVYQNPKPYLLCIMTRGDDWNELKEVIRDLAKLTYEEVEGQRK